ncbi:MAG: acetolactate synthase small subunit [Bdellovibrionota bacterium]
MPRSYTISAFTENTPGVLQRLTIIFSRRKVNIDSLTVSETETKGISRFTIVISVEPDLIQKLAKQLNRIIEVVDVFVAENHDLLYREIAFFKVATASPRERAELEELAHRYGAIVTLAKDSYLVIEKTGTEEQINSLFLLLEPYGMKEFVRSGRIAIANRERTPNEMFLTR